MGSLICWLFLQYKENVPNFKILTPEPQTLAYNVYLNTYNKHGLLTRSAMVLAVVILVSFESQRLKEVGERGRRWILCVECFQKETAFCSGLSDTGISPNKTKEKVWLWRFCHRWFGSITEVSSFLGNDFPALPTLPSLGFSWRPRLYTALLSYGAPMATMTFRDPTGPTLTALEVSSHNSLEELTRRFL